ncbi:aminoacyl-tRNA hydrolase [Victivallis sp. Marseille-Q1083]|uniref:aminoacyl-tRNA hydrolase n=1 Tax=Victivallis sp. Marseille-Q1083 TaxID=2717288 RepID=UPI001C37BBE7|nr:aminoacyl-tRNA hydrolase [Victivallis sp. Marseille-Q1083]
MQTANPIRLVVGLGNPGGEYAATRHNIGFMALDALLAALPGSFEKRHGLNSFYWQGRFRGRNLYLQQPQTYMNLSGVAVRQLVNSANIMPEEILVVHDDLDLELGRIRLRRGGSSGGHRGIESMLEELSGGGFNRLRLGIGRDGHTAVPDYVLSPFGVEEQPLLKLVLETATEAAVCALARGVGAAMNEFNGRDLAAELAAKHSV